MDCRDYRAILETPETERSRDSARELAGHLEHCPDCRVMASRFDAVIRMFRERPERPAAPELYQRLMDRVSEDSESRVAAASGTAKTFERPGGGVERLSLPGRTALSGGSESGGAGRTVPFGWRSRLFRPRWAILGSVPVLAAAAVLLWIVQPAPPPSTIRVKGDGDGLIPRALDLQVSIERERGLKGPVVERAVSGMAIGPHDGLIFRFAVEGAEHLAVLERDPTGRVELLYQRDDLDPTRKEPQVVEISDADGVPMRYVPEGPPGDYLFVAVASDDSRRVAVLTEDTRWIEELEPLPLIDPPGAGVGRDLPQAMAKRGEGVMIDQIRLSLTGAR